jgi:hypothetical protein
MHLAFRYLKSATLSYKYTEKEKRIFSLLVTIFWVIAIGITGIFITDGIQGALNYDDALMLRKDLPTLRQNSIEYFKPSTGESRQFAGIDVANYERLGVIDAKFWDVTAPDRAIKHQKEKMFSFVYVPIILILFFLLPWLVVRLIFWIRTADNTLRI